MENTPDIILATALEAKTELNNKEVPVKEELDKDEQAAIFINQAHKEFRRLAFALADRKKHSVSRVLEAVLFEPLEEVPLQGKQEEALFAICKDVLYNKGVVLQYAFEQIEKKKGEINDNQNEK